MVPLRSFNAWAIKHVMTVQEKDERQRKKAKLAAKSKLSFLGEEEDEDDDSAAPAVEPPVDGASAADSAAAPPPQHRRFAKLGKLHNTVW